MKPNNYLLYLSSSFVSSYLAVSIPAQAQIVPDNSLPVSTEVIRQSDKLVEIVGGTEAGINLFHSFAEFSVEEGNIASFINNNSDIQNVIGRVTGASASEIFGQIEAGGTAPNFNLFLLNPNGIIFGSNASLNLNGSFVATTANAIQFGDRGFFDTSSPNDPSLLTVQPSAFFFNQINPNSIRNQSRHQTETISGEPLPVGLQVPDDKSLLLLGGDVTIDGGMVTAPNGRVELGGLSETGTVALDINGNDLSLSFPSNVMRSNVLLTNGAKVDVRDRGSGSIAINARNIEIAGFSELASGILENFESSGGEAGEITLQATEKVIIDDSQIGSLVDKGAIGNSGDIKIKANSLDLVNGAFVFTRSNGQGDTGNISIDIRDDITLRGRSIGSTPFATDIINRVDSDGEGQGGDITIEAKSLSLADAASIQTATRGQGNAGNIIIRVDDIVSLENIANRTTQIRTVVEAGAIGNGGTIDIKTRSLLLKDGSQLAASIFREDIDPDTNQKVPGGRGKGGDITVNASDSVTISGITPEGEKSERFPSGIIASTEIGAEGDAGNITVNTNFFRIADSAIVSSRTSNLGSGGNISINANTFEAFDGGQMIVTADSLGDAGSIIVNSNDFVTLAGSNPALASRTIADVNTSSGIFARSDGTGTAGNVTINTPQLEIQEGAEISAASITAQGGDITLQGLDILQVNNSNISASTEGGNAGNLSITATESVQLSGTGGLLVEATEGGTAGNLTVETGQMSISDGAQVSVSNPQGQAGNLTINANSLFLNQGSITAETGNSNGEAGANISLEISDLLTLGNESQISATANGLADGGNINIDAEFIIAVPNQNSDIIATAAQGIGGNIDINTNTLFGITERSSTPTNNTNDIDASSEFGLDGTVNINEIDVNPAEALEELPADVIDVARLVAQNLCQQGQGSEFIVTGKGGIAPSPTQARDGELGEVNLVEPALTSSSTPVPQKREAINYSDNNSQEIVEAQGWVVNDRGILELVAYSTDPHHSPLQLQGNRICNASIK